MSLSASPSLRGVREHAPDYGLLGWAGAAETRAQLQHHIYGRLPDLTHLALTDVAEVRRVRSRYAAETWRFKLDADGASFALDALVVTPRQARVHTMLHAQCFRAHRAGLNAWKRGLRGERHGSSLRRRTREFILGAHIHTPPFEDIADAGVGLVLYHPADIVPDHKADALTVMEALSGADAPADRGGVLAHWASLAIAVRARLAERYPAVAHVAWGHSRHGKAALLAAAFDPGFGAVIAHQSGRYGAAMTLGGRGESVAQIARAFPHWFSKRMLAERGRGCEVDQQHLLALIAPRPVFLGGARSDFWADHAGAVRAAHCAAPAFGALGLSTYPDLSGAIVSFERPGWHGVTGEDWGSFLAFLSAKFDQRSGLGAGAPNAANVGGP